MSSQLGPDWQKIAEAQKIEISEKQRERLASLGRTIVGLRGLIDWTEQPITIFDCSASDVEPGGDGEARP